MTTEPLSRQGSDAALASFFGRERDLRALRALFQRGERLVTIVGPSGMGKTRLAARFVEGIQAERAPRFAEETLCALSEARALGAVVEALARALGSSLKDLYAAQKPAEHLARLLRARQGLLLILDNAEYVAEPVASLVGDLARRAPDVRWLVTSLRPLGLPFEVRYELSPLDEEDAIGLFTSRAQAVRGGPVGERPRDRAAVAQIVRQLDRIPLAIELAAGRAGVLSPQDLLCRLTDRFELLRDGRRRDAGDRHSTLRAAIDWSFCLLSPPERAALRKLTIFRGGLSLEAAEAVLSLGGTRAIDAVEALREKSFVHAYTPAHGAELRFDLYESVRAYASEGGAELDDRASLRERHAAHYLAKAESWAEAARRSGALSGLQQLELERENLLAALEASRVTDPEAVARIVLALDCLHATRGPFSARVELLSEAVAAARSALRPDLLARALAARGDALRVRGQWAEAKDDLRRAGALARRARDRALESAALMMLGNVVVAEGRPALGRAQIRRALATARAAGARWHEGQALRYLGTADYLSGRVSAARASYEGAIAVARAMGDEHLEGLLLGNLGTVERAEGRFSEARALYEQALSIHRRQNNRPLEALALGNLAVIEHELGRLEEARAGFERALTLDRAVGDLRLTASDLVNLGIVLLEEERLPEARARLSEARRLARTMKHRPLELFALMHLGAVHAAADCIAEAEHAFNEARAALRAVGDPALRAALSVLEALLYLAQARRSGADEGPSGALPPARHLKAARRRFQRGSALQAEGDPRVLGTLVPRAPILNVALRLVGRALERVRRGQDAPRALIIGPDARWFRGPGGAPVHLGRRETLRRILVLLVERRLERPGEGAPAASLVSIGWPGEKMRGEAGANRVRVAVAALRSLGLREVLLRTSSGYAIDPTIEVRTAADRARPGAPLKL